MEPERLCLVKLKKNRLTLTKAKCQNNAILKSQTMAKMLLRPEEKRKQTSLETT